MVATGNGQKAILLAMLVALATAMGTVAVFFFAIAGSRVDRAEVLELIQTTAPYVIDRGVLLSGVQNNTRAIKDLTAQVDAMGKEQARTGTKLDILLDRIYGVDAGTLSPRQAAPSQ
jgi:hypothetical protein